LILRETQENFSFSVENFQVFDFVGCNGIDIAAVWVAVNDDERAIESVAVGDASRQIHSAVGEFDKGV